MADVLTENQFVTFRIDEELFAVNVYKVREILEVPGITKVPGMPPLIRGVINIRGDVVPVIDLRMKFGDSETEFTQDTAIIVLELVRGDEVLLAGVLVDAANEVKNLDEDQIEPPPKMGAVIDNSFISGMGKTDDGFMIILNIDKLLSDEEISAVIKTAEQ